VAAAGGGEEGTAAAATATTPMKRNLYVRSLPQVQPTTAPPPPLHCDIDGSGGVSPPPPNRRC
jgi:hypothetical protein